MAGATVPSMLSEFGALAAAVFLLVGCQSGLPLPMERPANAACDAAFQTWIETWSELGAEAERASGGSPVSREKALQDAMTYFRHERGLPNRALESCSRPDLLSANERFPVLRPSSGRKASAFRHRTRRRTHR